MFFWKAFVSATKPACYPAHSRVRVPEICHAGSIISEETRFSTFHIAAPFDTVRASRVLHGNTEIDQFFFDPKINVKPFLFGLQRFQVV